MSCAIFLLLPTLVLLLGVAGVIWGLTREPEIRAHSENSYEAIKRGRAELKTLFPLGSPFEYLGRVVRVKGHGWGFAGVGLVGDYADDSGVVRPITIDYGNVMAIAKERQLGEGK